MELCCYRGLKITSPFLPSLEGFLLDEICYCANIYLTKLETPHPGAQTPALSPQLPSSRSNKTEIKGCPDFPSLTPFLTSV